MAVQTHPASAMCSFLTTAPVTKLHLKHPRCSAKPFSLALQGQRFQSACTQRGEGQSTLFTNGL